MTTATTKRKARQNSPPWGDLISIRPGTVDDDVAIVVDLHELRSARVDRRALADLVMGKETDGDRPAGLQKVLEARGWLRPEGHARQEDIGAWLNQIRHWRERGWQPSLDWYLASRNRHFADLEDDSGGVRQRVIKEYLEAGDAPEPVVPPGEMKRLVPGRLPDTSVELGALLLARSSVRRYDRAPVPEDLLASSLYFGLAAMRRRSQATRSGHTAYLGTYATLPDVYVVIYSVAGIDPGVYYYDLAEHALILVQRGSLRERMQAILQGQPWPLTAGWTVVLVADFAQHQWRYRHESMLRKIYTHYGHFMQNLIVACEAFGLGNVPTPAHKDSDLCALLRVDPTRHAPLYTLTVGRKPGAD
jgi:SagB-type dehydrogenase family enzyme